MPENLQLVQRPELVIGLAGPIGVRIDWVKEVIESSLKAVNYNVESIKLTSEMQKFSLDGRNSPRRDYHSQVTFKMTYATDLCKKFDDPSILSKIGILEIRRKRREITQSLSNIPEGVAYIINQLKRPHEIELLRQVYGNHFVLVSAYGSVRSRLAWIIEQIKVFFSAEYTASEIEKLARDLIEKDADESGDVFGQHLRDAYHMADVFVSGMDKAEIRSTVDRFIQALFGRNDIAPSKYEYGMYAAKSASLRSSDLSRQVGAAIFSAEGEIISQGCNEVPKAFGGTYWDLEQPDFRDVKIGHDPNEKLKNEILRDLFRRLYNAGYLAPSVMNIETIPEIVEQATKRPVSMEDKAGPLYGALIMDLTEYGRVVHAEMCAICDAARIGRSVRSATLFCTTFPCHNCTKHILAAGISKVIYMEPYPKSRAKDLHENEIEIEEPSTLRVSFLPFMGISPVRYRDIFQKGRRKSASGDARQWYKDAPQPMMNVVYPAYTSNEDLAAAQLVSDFSPPS